jgi:PQQ enzyme repeat
MTAENNENTVSSLAPQAFLCRLWENAINREAHLPMLDTSRFGVIIRSESTHFPVGGTQMRALWALCVAATFSPIVPPASAQIPRDPTPIVAKTSPADFFALDAETGKPLWEVYLGSSLRSNPVTYAVDAKQYVFVTAGTTYFVFALP